MTTRSWAGLALAAKYGRASASTASVSRRICRISSQFLRSFWNGALACVSARNFCQSSVLDTSFTTRLRLSR